MGEAARTMLGLLSGRAHEVLTSVVVLPARGITRSFVERTEVTFAKLSDAEIDAYIATGEPFDKAGGYGIQSKGGLLVQGIKGDYYNVVGLPIAGLARLLSAELCGNGAAIEATTASHDDGPTRSGLERRRLSSTSSRLFWCATGSSSSRERAARPPSSHPEASARPARQITRPC